MRDNSSTQENKSLTEDGDGYVVFLLMNGKKWTEYTVEVPGTEVLVVSLLFSKGEQRATSCPGFIPLSYYFCHTHESSLFHFPPFI